MSNKFQNLKEEKENDLQDHGWYDKEQTIKKPQTPASVDVNQRY